MILTTPLGKFEGTLEECLRVARLIGDIKQPEVAALDRLDNALIRFRNRSRDKARVLMLADREYERLGRLMTSGIGGFPGPDSRYQFNGIDIVGHLGVEPGTVVIADENMKVLGAFSWSAKE